MDLNQVTISVRDIKKSISFYEKIGLTLIVHTHDRYARFECPNANATLSLHLADKDEIIGGTALYFETPNLDEVYLALKSKGVIFDPFPKDQTWPKDQEWPKDQTWLWREAWFKDPDGHRLCLYYAGEMRKNPPWRKT